jgi:hypothetical protein
MIIASIVAVLVLMALTATVAYGLGERHVRELILHGNGTGAVTNSSSDNAAQLQGTIDSQRSQLNRLTNDYESACYRYQELYAAYDKLYAQAGASSGQAKIARPDGARGNEVSCYR